LIFHLDLEFDEEKGLLRKTKEVTETEAVKEALGAMGLAPKQEQFTLGKQPSEEKEIKLKKLRLPGLPADVGLMEKRIKTFCKGALNQRREQRRAEALAQAREITESVIEDLPIM